MHVFKKSEIGKGPAFSPDTLVVSSVCRSCVRDKKCRTLLWHKPTAPELQPPPQTHPQCTGTPGKGSLGNCSKLNHFSKYSPNTLLLLRLASHFWSAVWLPGCLCWSRRGVSRWTGSDCVLRVRLCAQDQCGLVLPSKYS